MKNDSLPGSSLVTRDPEALLPLVQIELNQPRAKQSFENMRSQVGAWERGKTLTEPHQ